MTTLALIKNKRKKREIKIAGSSVNMKQCSMRRTEQKN